MKFASVILFGVLIAAGASTAAHAQPQDYYNPSSSALGAGGARSGFLDFLSSLYLGVRGGGFFYDNQTTTPTSISGYVPAGGNNAERNTDFTSTFADSLTIETRETAGALVSLGYGTLVPDLYGSVRLEFEYGYQLYDATACTGFIPVNLDTAVAFPSITTDVTNATTTTINEAHADRQAQARTQVSAVLRNRNNRTCQNWDDVSHTFLFNLLYDMDLDEIAGGGMLPGLHMTVGFGLGYVLAPSLFEPVLVTAGDSEPIFNPTTTSGSVTLGTTPDGLSGPDTNDVYAQPPALVESGFLLPLFAGFSYSFVDLADFPLSLEVMYRYDSVRPTGIGQHSVIGGARYQF